MCKANHWFFWYEFKGDRGYIVLEKSGYPEIPNTGRPFPLDARTGQPSYCADNTAHKMLATTLMPTGKPQPDSDNEGQSDKRTEEAAWHIGDHIILCPRSFERGAAALAAHPPAPFTHLNDLEIVAMTLYHEIFHIVDADNDDQKRRGPKHDDDGHPVHE